MTLHPRRLVLPLVLASFLLVTISPAALHAQNTQTQNQSTTTKSKKNRKKTKRSKAEKSAAEANSGTNVAAPSSATPAEPPHTTATNERSHATSARSAHAQTPPSPGMVWVNTESRIYHKAGSRWYGETKQGKWMTEADAQKAGYKAAKH